jgi:hypothetical protein
MVTIVKHINTGKKYILIGAGFAAYKTSKPPTFIANRLPKSDEEEISMVAVCDENGEIEWLSTDEFKVVKVDGNSPLNILEHK